MHQTNLMTVNKELEIKILIVKEKIGIKIITKRKLTTVIPK